MKCAEPLSRLATVSKDTCEHIKTVEFWQLCRLEINYIINNKPPFELGLRISHFAVFLEHAELDSYISAMCALAADKTYHCGVCHKQAARRQDIERHLESVHIVTEPFVCEVCGASMKTRPGLQRHIRSHKNAFGGLAEVKGEN